MEGYIAIVREASVKSSEAARQLVDAAEKLAADVLKNEAQVFALGKKVDQLRAAELRLQELTDEIAQKRAALDDAKAKYDSFMASLPRPA